MKALPSISATTARRSAPIVSVPATLASKATSSRLRARYEPVVPIRPWWTSWASPRRRARAAGRAVELVRLQDQEVPRARSAGPLVGLVLVKEHAGDGTLAHGGRALGQGARDLALDGRSFAHRRGGVLPVERDPDPAGVDEGVPHAAVDDVRGDPARPGHLHLEPLDRDEGWNVAQPHAVEPAPHVPDQAHGDHAGRRLQGEGGSGSAG